MPHLVRLILPLCILHQVEKADSSDSGSSLMGNNDKASILISTSQHSFFLFSQLRDRDFVIEKISELLAKLPKYDKNFINNYIDVLEKLIK